MRLSELRAGVIPPIVFETKMHARRCDRAARHYLGDTDLILVGTLANYYSRHAEDCANGTAVQFACAAGLISEDNPLTFSSGDCAFGLDSDLCEKEFLGNWQEPTANSERLRSVRFRMRIVLRAIAHRVFRVIGSLRVVDRKRPVGENYCVTKVFRTWVDVSLALFGSQSKDGLVLVYPFPLNFRRQLKYIDQLGKDGYRFQLFGAPYPLWDILLWAIRPRDRRLAELEQATMERHATELVEQFDVSNLVTSEDFEIGSFAFTSRLRELGVCVENYAHGVGKYCPYVSYDRFVVLNDAQEDYYRQFGNIGEFEYFPEKSSDWSSIRPRALVLVDQLISRDGSLLDRLEQEILTVMKTVAENYKLELEIKLHPNSKLSADERRDGVKQVDKIRWSSGEAIFITVFSTAFLTFREMGRTMLVGNRYIDPRLVFGRHAPVIDVRELENVLVEMCDAETYR